MVYRAVAQYALDKVEPQLDGIATILWTLIKPQLDANWRRYRNGCKGGAPVGNTNNINGRKGKTNQEPTENQPKVNRKPTKNQANNNVNDNDNVNVNDNVEDKSSKITSQKSSRFLAPTLSEIEKYINENKYNVDAATFIDFYASKGWMVGKNKMKDWRAAVRTWERKTKTEKNAKPEEIGVILRDNSSTKYDNDKLW